jgi:hypothetical protein
MNDESKEMLDNFRKLSKEGKRESLFHIGLILKVESAMRRQYGLSPDGYNTNSPAQSGAAPQ